MREIPGILVAIADQSQTGEIISPSFLCQKDDDTKGRAQNRNFHVHGPKFNDGRIQREIKEKGLSLFKTRLPFQIRVGFFKAYLFHFSLFQRNVQI